MSLKDFERHFSTVDLLSLTAHAGLFTYLSAGSAGEWGPLPQCSTMAKQKCTKCKKLEYLSCSCCQLKMYVDNSLLMFVSTYRSRVAQLNMKNAVLNHYNDDDITEARQVMEDSVKMVIPEHILFGKKRTGSVNRSACDAMITDILDLFKDLEKLDEDIPKFVCSNAALLPPAAPEAAGSLMTALETIAIQQRQIKQIQESMSSMLIDFESVKTRVDKNEKMLTSKPKGQVMNVASTANDAPPRDDGRVKASESRDISSSSTDNTVATEQGANSSHATSSYAEVTRATEETGFEKAGKRPNKGVNKSQHSKTVKQKSQGGSDDSNILKSGPDTFQVTITNVNNSLDETKIKDYVSSKGIEAKNIEDTSSTDWSTKRFLLTFSFEHYEQVMAKEFWPKRIYYRRWFPARTKK